MENKSKWTCIFEDFINGDKVSYSFLAKKYNISPGAIYNRAKKERWYIVRQMLREKVAPKGDVNKNLLLMISDSCKNIKKPVKESEKTLREGGEKDE